METKNITVGDYTFKVFDEGKANGGGCRIYTAIEKETETASTLFCRDEAELTELLGKIVEEFSA
jgi:hypothetical protein